VGVTLEPGGDRIPRTVEDVHAEYRLSEPWAQALYEHQPVVFDLARVKLVGLGAIGACFAVLGLLLVRDETGFGVVMASLCIFIGIGVGVRAVRLLTFSSRTVQVETLGIRIRPGKQEYPWHDILGASSWRQNHNHFVGLLLTEPARAQRFAHRSTTYQRVRRVLTWPHGDEVVLADEFSPPSEQP
jgi:hypothetical protein